MSDPHYGLCWRCEWRAKYHETGSAPRCECGSQGAVCGCYMYRPVAPVALKQAPGDKRPRFAGAMFCSRERFAGVAEVTYHLTKTRQGAIVYAAPTGKLVKETIPPKAGG